MSNMIYKKKQFCIYKARYCGCSSGFIVHNKNLRFADGHTHVSDFHTAKCLIDLALYKQVPRHMNLYMLNSLLRISDDEDYKQKIVGVLKEQLKKKRKVDCENRFAKREGK